MCYKNLGHFYYSMIIVCPKLTSSSLYYEFYLKYTYLPKIEIDYRGTILDFYNDRHLFSPTAKENDSQERKQIPYRDV